ncbi:MAG: SHOCT domain-containing protein [Anaerolineaceae bacterium]|jgi:putative membrane protein|nr:SHOCT domain-containing protein [Anaerolineaceae bacterium]
MMGYWFGGIGWIFLIINLVLLIGAFIAVVFLVIWIVKQLSNNNPGQALNNDAESAVEIARERYAKGDITREEYQKLIIDLERGR